MIQGAVQARNSRRDRCGHEGPPDGSFCHATVDGGVAQMVVWLRWWCGSDGGVAAFYKESPAKHANERLVSVVVLELFGSFFDCGFEVLWSQ